MLLIRLDRFSPRKGCSKSHIVLARTNCGPAQFLAQWTSGPLPLPQAPGLSQSRPALFAHSLTRSFARRSSKSPTFLLPLNQTRCPQSTGHQRGGAKQRLSSQSHHRPNHHTSLRPLHLTSFSPPHLLSLTSPHLHSQDRYIDVQLACTPPLRVQFYARDGLRRPLDNGCSLMRSRTDELKL